MIEQPPLFAEAELEQGEIERWCASRGIELIVGVDEAGRGPLAGPVYSAAVALAPTAADEDWIEGLDDSKKMTEEERERMARVIRESVVAWSITWRDQGVIDEINILQATLRSMEDAIEACCGTLMRPPDRVFVDGNQPVRTEFPQQTLVKGDGRSLAVAAAGVLAKTARDAVMRQAHDRWPEYNFFSNKGYGSREHRDAIVEFGPCALHRLTFGGVREYIDRLRSD